SSTSEDAVSLPAETDPQVSAPARYLVHMPDPLPRFPHAGFATPGIVRHMRGNPTDAHRRWRSRPCPVHCPAGRATTDQLHGKSCCTSFTPPNSTNSRFRARYNLDITVPMGIPSAEAISL